MAMFLVKKWLRGEALVDTTSDVLGEVEEEQSPAKNTPNSHGRCGLVWKGKTATSSLKSSKAGANTRLVDETNLHDLGPNDTLVIPAEFGGWNAFGHVPGAPNEPDPEAWRQAIDKSSVTDAGEANELARIDVADQAFSQSRARTILRVHEKLLVQDSTKALFEVLVKKISKPNADLRTTSVIEELKERDDYEQLLGEADADIPRDGWEGTILRRLIELPETLKRYPDGIVWTSRLHPDRATGMPPLPLATFGDEDDSLSETGHLALIQHLADVFAEATRLTEATSLPESLRRTITTAAKLHDVGKADPRFQAMLIGKPVSVAHMQRTLWAKSEKLGGRRSSELPAGFRHEMLTVDLLLRFEDGGSSERALLAHIVASHHGYARPLAPVAERR